MILNGRPDAAAIADTIAAVFRSNRYEYPQLTPWQRFVIWLSDQINKLLELAHGGAWGGVFARVVLYSAIACLIIWISAELIQRRYAPGRFFQRAGTKYEDPWRVAARLGEAGQYLDAVHALYAGLLISIATKGYVVLHESKTLGDYSREMRRKGSQTTYSNFVQFGKSYETVVYDLGSCSANQYASLYEMAAKVAGRSQ